MSRAADIRWLPSLTSSHIGSTMSAASEQRLQSSYAVGCRTTHSGTVLRHRCLFPTTLASRFIGVHAWSYVMVCVGTHLCLVQLHQKPSGSFHTVCIDRHVPEHAPFAICLGVGQDDQVRFARTASQHTIDRRSGTSAPHCLPRKTKVDVTKCHACHAKRRWM